MKLDYVAHRKRIPKQRFPNNLFKIMRERNIHAYQLVSMIEELTGESLSHPAIQRIAVKEENMTVKSLLILCQTIKCSPNDLIKNPESINGKW